MKKNHLIPGILLALLIFLSSGNRLAQAAADDKRVELGSALFLQAGSGQDLIAAVNQFRASYGLVAYEASPALNKIAQQHSEYQASIGQATHTRADGGTPETLGFTENIMSGMGLSPQAAVEQWSDYWHMNTMVGYTQGYVGAGAAEKDGLVYYTLVVKNTGRAFDFENTNPEPASAQNTATSGTPTSAATATPTATIPPELLVTHEVQAGESLWQIAVDNETTVDDLVELNALDPDSLVINPGQMLIISILPSPTPSATPTSAPPTETPTVTPSATPTQTQTATPEPTQMPSATPLPAGVLGLDQGSLPGAGLIGLAGFVLGIVGGVLIGSRLQAGRSRKSAL